MSMQERNIFMDFPVDILKTCEVFTPSGECFFKGVNIETEYKMSSDSVNSFSLERKLIIQGSSIYFLGRNNNGRNVSFFIRYKRTNVIEILKHGQFIAITGQGVISNLETTYTCIPESPLSKQQTEISTRIKNITTLIIQVSGELTIK
jgi:hypothetical protein